MEAVIDNKKKNGGFDFEFIDYQDTNNDFLVEKVDFNDVKNPNVIPIEEIDKKTKNDYISNKTEYIELDESLLNGDVRINEVKNDIRKSNPVIDGIEFNGLRGSYTISYHELGSDKKEEMFISKSTFYDNERRKKQKFAKTNVFARKLKKLDMNLYSILVLFDKKHGTNTAEEYLNGNNKYNTKYNLKNIFKNREYEFKDKLSFISIANKQKRKKKVEVENPKGIYAAPALASLALLFGFLGINSSIKNKTDYTDSNSKIISEVNTTESELTEAKIDGLITEISTTEDISVEKIDTEKEEKVIDSAEEVVQEKKSLKLHDSFKLDNMDLEYSPIENKKHINTNNLEYVESYKMSRVCAYEGNTILFNEKVDNMDNESLDDLISKLHNQYGDNIKIFANFNGYDKNGEQVLENIGWSDIKKLNVKDVSFKKEQINKLKKAKETLLSLTTDNSRTTSYQKIK